MDLHTFVCGTYWIGSWMDIHFVCGTYSFLENYINNYIDNYFDNRCLYVIGNWLLGIEITENGV